MSVDERTVRIAASAKVEASRPRPKPFSQCPISP
jgi:hypothetical protein